MKLILKGTVCLSCCPAAIDTVGVLRFKIRVIEFVLTRLSDRSSGARLGLI